MQQKGTLRLNLKHCVKNIPAVECLTVEAVEWA